MLWPTGLDRFQAAFPGRTYDVGIAEQHAVTSAAGLAFTGQHPVVAVYSTFLNRAFDQVLLDVALHRAGVTFVLDRAGITGEDGASHNGMWDLSVLSIVPGIRVAAPRDEASLRQALREAVAVDDGPTVVRFPKGALPEPLPAVDLLGTLDLLHSDEAPDVLVVGVGGLAGAAREAAAKLAADGVRSVVAAPLWVTPLPVELVELAGQVGSVVTIEDNGVVGGVGSALAVACADAGVPVRMRRLGIPQKFLAHCGRAALLDSFGLTAQSCAEAARDLLGHGH
jgi:1-deoxy-D-xylulose-5-phosphate synthase